MKTLINALYIGLLIIAPVGASYFLIGEEYQQMDFHCPFNPILLVMLACFAALFAPMILALIQNTAHKIAISPLNLAVIGAIVTPFCKDGNQTGFAFIWVAVGALWLWQCFDGRRPRKLPESPRPTYSRNVPVDTTK